MTVEDPYPISLFQDLGNTVKEGLKEYKSPVIWRCIAEDFSGYDTAIVSKNSLHLCLSVQILHNNRPIIMSLEMGIGHKIGKL